MTNAELLEQFKLCQQWRDTDQWIALAVMYLERGYTLNAVYCFRQSEACRVEVINELVCLTHKLLYDTL